MMLRISILFEPYGFEAVYTMGNKKGEIRRQQAKLESALTANTTYIRSNP